MKNESSNKNIYFGIYTIAVGATLLFLEFYHQSDFSIIGLLSFFGIDLQNIYVKGLLEFVVNWAIYAVFYIVIYKFTELVWKNIWRWKHSDIYIDGVWLHIHDKENVKIGVVDIKQDFNEVIVNAQNVKPNGDAAAITKWHYVGAQFEPDENSVIKLIGCYMGKRQYEANKQGIHLYRDFERRSKTLIRIFGKKIERKEVYKLSGEFGDALAIDGHRQVTDISDRTGKIILIKMTKELRQYIDYKSINSFNYDKLKWIMSEREPKIANCEYVKTLNKIYSENKFMTERNDFQEQYSGDFDEVRNLLYDVLVYAMSVDGKIEKREEGMVARLVGLNHPITYYVNRPKNLILEDIKQVYEKIKKEENPFLVDLFCSILNSSCRSVVLANLEEQKSENDFLGEIREIISVTTTKMESLS